MSFEVDIVLDRFVTLFGGVIFFLECLLWLFIVILKFGTFFCAFSGQIYDYDR